MPLKNIQPTPERLAKGDIVITDKKASVKKQWRVDELYKQGSGILSDDQYYACVIWYRSHQTFHKQDFVLMKFGERIQGRAERLGLDYRRIYLEFILGALLPKHHDIMYQLCIEERSIKDLRNLPDRNRTHAEAKELVFNAIDATYEAIKNLTKNPD